jgi:D-lactate dehydrogenase
LSHTTISDPLWHELSQFDNVILTAHQAFFTDTALDTIINSTLQNAQAYLKGKPLQHTLTGTLP